MPRFAAIWLALVACVVLVQSQTSSQCRIDQTSSNGQPIHFDLTALTRDTAQGDYRGQAGVDHFFHVNVCAPCAGEGGRCASESGTVCQYDGNSVLVAVVATDKANNRGGAPVVAPISLAAPEKGMKISTKNGDICADTGLPRESIVYLNCDLEADASTNKVTVLEEGAGSCIYHVNLYHPNACPVPEYSTIVSGVILNVLNLQMGKWAYYQIYVPLGINELRVIARTNSVDKEGWPGLFVRKGAQPTISAFDARDNSYGSVFHGLEIRTGFGSGKHLQPGSTYYIGLYANGGLIGNVSILASLQVCFNDCSGHGVCDNTTDVAVCHCNEGYETDMLDCSAPVKDVLPINSWISGSVIADHKAYFRFPVAPEDINLFIEVERTNNDGTANQAVPSIFVGFDYFPNIEHNEGYIRDDNSNGVNNDWDLTVVPPYLAEGTWIVAVQGSHDHVFSFRIRIRVCECEKCCSDHGACSAGNEGGYSCSCFPGYTGTADCSAPSIELYPEHITPHSVILNSRESIIMRIDVPVEVAISHVDLNITAVALPASPTSGPSHIVLYAQYDEFPDQWGLYEYRSSSPAASTATVVIPHYGLMSSIWYVLLVNYEFAPINVTIHSNYQGWCPCGPHGTCSAGEPGTCNCTKGYEGAACDIKSSSISSDGGVSDGTVAALVFVMIFVGLFMGIAIVHLWPKTFGASSEGGYQTPTSGAGAATGSVNAGRTGYNSL